MGIHARHVYALCAGVLAIGVLAVSATPALGKPGPPGPPKPGMGPGHKPGPGHGPKGTTCTGDLNNFPADLGSLSGTIKGNVTIAGACAVFAGPTVIKGDLTLKPGATLLAVFGLTNFQPNTPASTLSVQGKINVQNGAALIMGCIPTSFPCFDDPASNDPSIQPTLSSHDTVGHDLNATNALGVIVHNTSIGHNVRQDGGGGGVNCGPPDGPPPAGIFGAIQSPVFSDYEDSSVGGDLNVKDLRSCWLGMARDQVGHNLKVTNNQLADPDAVEILSNTVGKDLVCDKNSMTWDSADISPTGDLYPWAYEPNTVGGKRKGQCVNAPAIDMPGGVSPGPF